MPKKVLKWPVEQLGRRMGVKLSFDKLLPGYSRTMDCTGEITLPEGTEMVMPGDNVTITVELIYPVALNPGLRFAIREGGRTVGAGQITEILD